MFIWFRKRPRCADDGNARRRPARTHCLLRARRQRARRAGRIAACVDLSSMDSRSVNTAVSAKHADVVRCHCHERSIASRLVHPLRPPYIMRSRSGWCYWRRVGNPRGARRGDRAVAGYENSDRPAPLGCTGAAAGSAPTVRRQSNGPRAESAPEGASLVRNARSVTWRYSEAGVRAIDSDPEPASSALRHLSHDPRRHGSRARRKSSSCANEL